MLTRSAVEEALVLKENHGGEVEVVLLLAQRKHAEKIT